MISKTRQPGGLLRLKILLNANLYRLSLLVGHVIDTCLRNYTAYRDCRSKLHDGPLTPEQVEHYRQLCTNKPKSYIDARQNPISDSDIINPVEPLSCGAKLLLDVCKTYSDRITSVANVGAYTDRHSSYLAGKFPQITFTSIDFHAMDDLVYFNRLLPQHDNWKLASGYALDVLRAGNVPCDLVFMSSTSVLINSAEMDLYIDVCAERSKIVVLNEPWAAMGPFTSPFNILGPEDIDSDNSITRSVDGFYGWYQHNYIEKFRRKGFEIEKCEFVPVDSSTYWILNFVAVNNRNR